MTKATGKDGARAAGEARTAGADRRDFLKAMTGASAVAAVTAVAVVQPVEAEAAPASSGGRETREERVKARYQPDSPDVQAFYRTNRY